MAREVSNIRISRTVLVVLTRSIVAAVMILGIAVVVSATEVPCYNYYDLFFTEYKIDGQDYGGLVKLLWGRESSGWPEAVLHAQGEFSDHQGEDRISHESPSCRALETILSEIEECLCGVSSGEDFDWRLQRIIEIVNIKAECLE